MAAPGIAGLVVLIVLVEVALRRISSRPLRTDRVAVAADHAVRVSSAQSIARVATLAGILTTGAISLYAAMGLSGVGRVGPCSAGWYPLAGTALFIVCAVCLVAAIAVIADTITARAPRLIEPVA